MKTKREMKRVMVEMILGAPSINIVASTQPPVEVFCKSLRCDCLYTVSSIDFDLSNMDKLTATPNSLGPAKLSRSNLTLDIGGVRPKNFPHAVLWREI